MAKLSGFATMGIIATTMFGEQMFPALGVQVPELVNGMMQNKFTTCAGAWFFGNTVRGREPEGVRLLKQFYLKKGKKFQRIFFKNI